MSKLAKLRKSVSRWPVWAWWLFHSVAVALGGLLFAWRSK
jgi:hypothetical protein